MKVRNPIEYSKEIWWRMTKKDKFNFFVITFVIVILFLSIIAGGIVAGITGNYLLLIGGIVGFIGFGLSFPIIGRIKRFLAFKSIAQGRPTQTIAKITAVWVGWQAYKDNTVTALTLNIRCGINGIESRGWYKLTEKELRTVQTEKVMGTRTGSFGYSRAYHRNEISLNSLDRIFKIGDEIHVRYEVGKPKYCMVLGKKTDDYKVPISYAFCKNPNYGKTFEDAEYYYQSNELQRVDKPAVFRTELGERLLTELYSKKTKKQINEFLAEIKTLSLPAELLTELENEAELYFATIFH